MATSTEEMNPVLKAAMAAIDVASERSTVAVEKQEKITKEMGAAGDVIKGAIEEQTMAAQVVNLQSEIADLTAQNRTIDIIDSSNTVNALATLQRDLVETSLEVKTAQDKVEFVQEAPVEGVVDYFKQQFELAGLEGELKAARVREASLTTMVSNIAASTESVQRAVATTKRSKNLATIEAGQKVIQATGAIKLGQVELESLARNSQQIEASMRADAAELSSRLQANTLHNTAVNQKARERDQAFQEKAQEFQIKAYREQAEAREVALEAATLNLERLKATQPSAVPAAIAQNEKIVKDIEDNRRAEEIYVSNVQKAQASLGIPVEEPTIIIQRGMRAGSLKERVRYDAMNNMGTGEIPTFGVTVGDAVINTGKTGIAKSKPADLLELAKKTYLQGKKEKREDLPKDEATLKTEINNVAASITAGWESEVKQGDTSNPYHAPPMAVLAEDYEGVKNSKLFQAVLEPMDMKEFNAKELYKAAVAGIAAKTLTLEEAALGLETIFDSAVEYNNSTWMFERAGFAKQDSYKSEIVEPPFFSPESKGSAVGGGLALGALTVVSAPVTVPAAVVVVGGTALAGRSLGGMFEQPFPLVDSTKRPQVTQALIRLISDSSERSFFK